MSNQIQNPIKCGMRSGGCGIKLFFWIPTSVGMTIATGSNQESSILGCLLFGFCNLKFS